jgi:DNA modification methylase
MIRVIQGDCRNVLATLPDESVHCVVTSPPYFGLRDYGVDGQIGLEATPAAFVAEMVGVFRDVRRVLRSDGTVWLNLGDCYATAGGYGGDQAPSNVNGKQRTNEGARNKGCHKQVRGFKHKDLLGIPWRVAFALQADGWFLRQDIIWSKPNPMPESVTDRCTKAHEYLFLLSKSARYHYDADAIKEPAIYGDPRSPTAAYPGKNDFREGTRPIRKSVERGRFNGKTNAMPGREAFRAIEDYRNKRSVWEITSQPYADTHFATFPPALIEPCILAGCPKGGTVLDPFGGAGTTGLVADRLGRNAILIELNPEYAAMAERRIVADAGMFAEICR